MSKYPSRPGYANFNKTNRNYNSFKPTYSSSKQSYCESFNIGLKKGLNFIENGRASDQSAFNDGRNIGRFLLNEFRNVDKQKLFNDFKIRPEITNRTEAINYIQTRLGIKIYWDGNSRDYRIKFPNSPMITHRNNNDTYFKYNNYTALSEIQLPEHIKYYKYNSNSNTCEMINVMPTEAVFQSCQLFTAWFENTTLIHNLYYIDHSVLNNEFVDIIPIDVDAIANERKIILRFDPNADIHHISNFLMSVQRIFNFNTFNQKFIISTSDIHSFYLNFIVPFVLVFNNLEFKLDTKEIILSNLNDNASLIYNGDIFELPKIHPYIVWEEPVFNSEREIKDVMVTDFSYSKRNQRGPEVKKMSIIIAKIMNRTLKLNLSQIVYLTGDADEEIYKEIPYERPVILEGNYNMRNELRNYLNEAEEAYNIIQNIFDELTIDINSETIGDETNRSIIPGLLKKKAIEINVGVDEIFCFLFKHSFSSYTNGFFREYSVPDKFNSSYMRRIITDDIINIYAGDDQIYHKSLSTNEYQKLKDDYQFSRKKFILLYGHSFDNLLISTVLKTLKDSEEQYLIEEEIKYAPDFEGQRQNWFINQRTLFYPKKIEFDGNNPTYNVIQAQNEMLDLDGQDSLLTLKNLDAKLLYVIVLDTFKSQLYSIIDMTKKFYGNGTPDNLEENELPKKTIKEYIMDIINSPVIYYLLIAFIILIIVLIIYYCLKHPRSEPI